MWLHLDADLEQPRSLVAGEEAPHHGETRPAIWGRVAALALHRARLVVVGM